MGAREELQEIVEFGDGWRKAGYTGAITGGTLGIQPMLEAEEKYAEKGQDYPTSLILKHAAPTAVGVTAGSYAGRKAAQALAKRGMSRMAAGKGKPSLMAIRATALLPALAGGLIGNHYSRKMTERDHAKMLSSEMEDIIEFKDITDRQFKDRLSKQQYIEGNLGGFGMSALGGALPGMVAGGIAAGRRGVIKGGIAGIAAGIGARSLLQPALNRNEDAYLAKKRQTLKDDVKTTGIHAAAALAVPLTGAVAAIGMIRSKSGILKATKNMARKAKVYKRASDIRRGNPVKMKPSDYTNIVHSEPPAGMLREHNWSAKDELHSIISFGMMDKAQKLYEKHPKSMTAAMTGLGAVPSVLAATYFLNKARKRDRDKRHALIGEVPNSEPGTATMLSAREQLDTILFGNDPRPRSPLGQFTDANGEQISPQAIHVAYKEQQETPPLSGKNLGKLAVGGAAFTGGGMGLEKLLSKIKGMRAR